MKAPEGLTIIDIPQDGGVSVRRLVRLLHARFPDLLWGSGETLDIRDYGVESAWGVCVEDGHLFVYMSMTLVFSPGQKVMVYSDVVEQLGSYNDE